MEIEPENYNSLLGSFQSPIREYSTFGGKMPAKKELKLINNGTYGCIFHPGITCKGTPESAKYVTKIQKSKRTIKNEWRVSKKILTINGYARFFAPILKQCNVRIQKEESKELMKCDVFKNADNTSAQTYVSTKVRYVSNMDLRKYLIKSVPPQRFLLEIWRTHLYLLKAIEKLSSNGIVHYDLKDNNIMFDVKLNEPIIIDFGLSFFKSDLKATDKADNVFFTFADYSYWCIDILACSYIFSVIGHSHAKTEKVRESQLTEIFNVFMYGTEKPTENDKIVNSAFEYHLLNSREQFLKFKERYASYFSAFIGKTWWEMYEDLIQYVDTWDNYSVAVIYANLLDKAYFVRPEVTAKTLEKSRDEMSKYVNGLESIIYAMPNERASATDSMNMIPK